MSDAQELALVGSHAENLHSGAMLAPGGRVRDDELAPEDRWLVDEGRLVPVDVPPDKLEGDALQARARDLDIEGRSSMPADKLRREVAKAEKTFIEAARQGVSEGEARAASEGEVTPDAAS